jgi:hypothetical protein
MATATKERKTETLVAYRDGRVEPFQTPAEKPPYVMPTVYSGDMVLWYPHADPSQSPTRCIVESVENRTIRLTPYAGRIMGIGTSAVRHISDPHFIDKPGAKSDGAWDFTLDHKVKIEAQHAIRVDIDELKALVSGLQSEIQDLKAKGKKTE